VRGSRRFCGADTHEWTAGRIACAGTIDALIAHLCIRYGLTLLSTDRDFENIAKHTELKLWRSTV